MKRSLFALTAALAVLAARPALALSGSILLASTSDAGVKSTGENHLASVSADGTKVAFESLAGNLDPADPDNIMDIYVKDLRTGDITLASASDEGVKGNNFSYLPSISADGKRVAFESYATNLDPADTDGEVDIYVKDLVTGDITLASTSDYGRKGNADSFEPYLSADGRRVAFVSDATNFDPIDYSGRDIYVKNLVSGDIALASTSDAGVKANSDSYEPAISADGRKVAFESNATNLDPSDTDGGMDIYVKDLASGDIALASTSDSGAKGDGQSFDPDVSGDGSKAAFYSSSKNLDPGDTDANYDVYVKDLSTGDITLASTSDVGMKGNGNSEFPSLSLDGTHVAFQSAARNLDPVDTDKSWDVFVKDLSTGDIILASISKAGVKGDRVSNKPDLSATGTRVGFETLATNFDSRDHDVLPDIYVKEI